MKPRTTPGRLRWLAALLVAGIALVAATSGLRVARAGDDADILRTRTVPAVLALDQVAAALTEADRAASRELASGAFPLTGPGTDYQDAVKTAGQALADARERIGSSGLEAGQLRAVDGLIIEYTGLVGMAQSGREGPLAVAGVAYASDLLHAPDTGILARVGQLRNAELASVRKTRDDYWTSTGAVLPFVISVGLAIVVLVGIQIYLAGRFRRRINPQLAFATVFLLVLAAWQSTNALRTRDRIDTAAGSGTTRMAALWEARTNVQRVVGAESLALVSRGVGDDHRAASDAALRALADPALPDARARQDAASIRDVVAQIRGRGFGPPPPAGSADLAPRDGETVRLLLGGGPTTLTGLATDADAALASALAATRKDTERRLADAGDAQGLGIGGPVLCAAALAAGLWGLWRRYDEYRTGR
jgi:hypothetical protein